MIGIVRGSGDSFPERRFVVRFVGKAKFHDHPVYLGCLKVGLAKDIHIRFLPSIKGNCAVLGKSFFDHSRLVMHENGVATSFML